MYFLRDTHGQTQRFGAIGELKEYIETRHAEEGGWDWISEIADSKGRQYGCSWGLEIERIG
jgi:hypothetical protein